MILAARGARNLDGGEEKIDNPEMEARPRRRARRVQISSVIAAALLTALCLAIGR